MRTDRQTHGGHS